MDTATQDEYALVSIPGLGIQRRIPRGSRLLDALRSFPELQLYTPCGGTGRCGKCRVRILQGDTEKPGPGEIQRLDAGELRSGIRLACMIHVQESLTLEIPRKDGAGIDALLEFSFPLLDSGPVETPAPEPLLHHLCIAVPSESLREADDMVAWLTDAVEDQLAFEPGEITIDPALLPAVARLLASATTSSVEARVIDGRITAIAGAGELGQAIGLAVDIGTTTLALYLVDLVKGTPVASRGTANPQAFAGGDVISRISYAGAQVGGLTELRESLLTAVETTAIEMAVEHSLDPVRIVACTLAGNSVMLHLALGVDPASLARVPFLPVFLEGLEMPGRPFPRLPECRVKLLPGLAAYVGADIAAGFTALGRAFASDAYLYLDIGTNGEILLASNGTLYACAAAAGPAFEGASLSSGSGTLPGAVTAVGMVDGRLQTATVGGVQPSSICGTGVVDLIRLLLEYGLIDGRGRFRAAGSLPMDVPPELVERRITVGKTEAFIYSPLESETPPLLLTQRDIREVQLAKAAIATGIELLCRTAGISDPADLDLYLAGGFGFHLNPESAAELGLLPRIAPGRIHQLGNAAGRGAVAALTDRGFSRRARSLCKQTRVIDLAQEASFQQSLMKNIYFNGHEAV